MSLTDWISAGSLALLVILFARALLVTHRMYEAMIGQLGSERKWPVWARTINRKLERIMSVTKEIEAAMASLRAIENEIGIYAADAQARIADLEGKLAEAGNDTEETAAVEALQAELAAFKEKADALAAQFPEVQPTVDEEPAPEPAPEEAPAQ